MRYINDWNKTSILLSGCTSRISSFFFPSISQLLHFNSLIPFFNNHSYCLPLPFPTFQGMRRWIFLMKTKSRLFIHPGLLWPGRLQLAAIPPSVQLWVLLYLDQGRHKSHPPFLHPMGVIKHYVVGVHPPAGLWLWSGHNVCHFLLICQASRLHYGGHDYHWWYASCRDGLVLSSNRRVSLSSPCCGSFA